MSCLQCVLRHFGKLILLTLWQNVRCNWMKWLKCWILKLKIIFKNAWLKYPVFSLKVRLRTIKASHTSYNMVAEWEMTTDQLICNVLGQMQALANQTIHTVYEQNQAHWSIIWQIMFKKLPYKTQKRWIKVIQDSNHQPHHDRRQIWVISYFSWKS